MRPADRCGDRATTALTNHPSRHCPSPRTVTNLSTISQRGTVTTSRCTTRPTGIGWGTGRTAQTDGSQLVLPPPEPSEPPGGSGIEASDTRADGTAPSDEPTNEIPASSTTRTDRKKTTRRRCAEVTARYSLRLTGLPFHDGEAARNQLRAQAHTKIQLSSNSNRSYRRRTEQYTGTTSVVNLSSACSLPRMCPGSYEPAHRRRP